MTGQRTRCSHLSSLSHKSWGRWSPRFLQTLAFLWWFYDFSPVSIAQSKSQNQFFITKKGLSLAHFPCCLAKSFTQELWHIIPCPWTWGGEWIITWSSTDLSCFGELMSSPNLPGLFYICKPMHIQFFQNHISCTSHHSSLSSRLLFPGF